MKSIAMFSFGALLALPFRLPAADAAAPKADFEEVAKVFELNCVRCHHTTDRQDDIKGGYIMDNKDEAFKGGEDRDDIGPAITPGSLEKSSVYKLITATGKKRMPPPKAQNGELLDPLTADEIKLVSSWIEQGAPWPEGRRLQARKKKTEKEVNEDDVVAGIHALITAGTKVTDAAGMRAYTNTIPGTMVNYALLPIPGGEYVMGSPASEAGRNADEGPQHRVKLDPFWMGKTEVTWNEYELFMYDDLERAGRETIKTSAAVDKVSDAVSRPTRPYVEMSFGMGKDGFPAISMTQHAANKYCEWLSAKTGHFYRLPTEAEWEYACRAGTTTAYSFGNDPSKLGDYAWYFKNSDKGSDKGQYHKVGTKKPNPWGLYDMHGNVAEWCLDQFNPKGYAPVPELSENPWTRSTKPYPQVVRGGSWDDDAERLRSAARRGSDKSWKQQDPQLPKSKWFHTDAQFLGFRLVRPLKVPAAEELKKYWNSGVEKE